MEIQIPWTGSHINRISLFSGRNLGLVLSLVFPQTLPNWPSAYTTAYVLAGILGIIVTLSLLVMYKMRLKEVGDAAEKFFANLPK
jgi:hypothetical protein